MANLDQSIIDQRLLEQQHSGATPVGAIKQLCAEFGMSLAEAKLAFAGSAAWANEAKAGDQLHQEIIEADQRGELD